MNKIAKRAIAGIGGLLMAAVAWASTVVYSRNLVNEPALAYSNTYQIDLKTAGANGRSIDQFSAQAIYSSATVAATSFTDGRLSNSTVTVANNGNLVGTQATDQITVVSTTGLLNATITIRGKVLRQGYDWKIKSSTVTTATDIARIMNYISGIHASAAGGVVYATATSAGIAGNSFTLSASTSALTVASALFTGGVDNAYVSVNGTRLTQGTAWTRASTSSGTAKAISDAIMGNSTLSALVTSTWTAGGLVTLHANTVGVNEYALVGYPAASLVAASTGLANGSASAYTINTSRIHKVSHGLSTGLPVLYSTSGFSLGGLTNQTTYYAARIDDNNFALATTSTGAVAGSYVTLTSSSTAGPHTFTLSPLAISGTFSFKWQYSNDGTTWLDVGVSSVTFGSPYTAGSTSWDFGDVNYRYLRVNVVAGSQGGIALQVSGYGKNDN